MSVPNGKNIDEYGVVYHVEYPVVRCALGDHKREFTLACERNYTSIEAFLLGANYQYRIKLTKAVEEFGSIETISHFYADFQENEDFSNSAKRQIHIPTRRYKIDSTTDLRAHFECINRYLERRVEELEYSELSLVRIKQLRVVIYFHKHAH